MYHNEGEGPSTLSIKWDTIFNPLLFQAFWIFSDISDHHLHFLYCFFLSSDDFILFKDCNKSILIFLWSTRVYLVQPIFIFKKFNDLWICLLIFTKPVLMFLFLNNPNANIVDSGLKLNPTTFLRLIPSLNSLNFNTSISFGTFLQILFYRI